MAAVDPTLELETRLFADGATLVIGCDEVGRGALAGPVTVGAVAICADAGVWPAGLRDSKALTDRRRHALVEPIREWAAGWTVASVDNTRIDGDGIVTCLREAASSAVGALLAEQPREAQAVVILDGSSDWLTAGLQAPCQVRVVIRAKADRDCASVAAASVLAKVDRDDRMAVYAEQYPQYSWQTNRGYGSAVHMAAIAEHGPSVLHRMTWLHQPGSRGDKSKKGS
ncbi:MULTISPECIES: ribonuclease HII [unclassified Pseudoclavibacter]|uniref:ribonuclease HII n=1 Tax=unclassified Pseudoclavibacter TaxID=2615177 RepID=UPI001300FD59|nr:MULTISPECIES: ribonuclease HII [unclassified Pseudoclavibacter]KAB1645691.1 ribonuclease HII [Pseudoclavibacter sp. CFCC 14310]KAB1664401.1 ribonuclease HII [Pseudoclavibacter sp. CFCC 13611]